MARFEARGNQTGLGDVRVRRRGVRGARPPQGSEAPHPSRPASLRLREQRQLASHDFPALRSIARPTRALHVVPGVPTSHRQRNAVVQLWGVGFARPCQPPRRLASTDLASPAIAIEHLQPIDRLVWRAEVPGPIPVLLAVVVRLPAASGRTEHPALVPILRHERHTTAAAWPRLHVLARRVALLRLAARARLPALVRTARLGAARPDEGLAALGAGALARRLRLRGLLIRPQPRLLSDMRSVAGIRTEAPLVAIAPARLTARVAHHEPGTAVLAGSRPLRPRRCGPLCPDRFGGALAHSPDAVIVPAPFGAELVAELVLDPAMQAHPRRLGRRLGLRPKHRRPRCGRGPALRAIDTRTTAASPWRQGP